MGIPLRILITEDSEDDALLLVRTLRRNGYDPVYERVDTADAMSEALDNREWDIVISDFVMPRFGGMEALKLMQSKGLDLPFIIVSGKIGEDIAVEAMRAGAQDYIMKNNLARLIPAIQRELDEAVVRQERRKAQDQLRIKDAAIASSVSGIAIADLDGKLTYVNKAFLDLWEFKSEEEVLGKHLSEFWESVDLANEVLHEVLEKGHWSGERQALRRAGSAIYVHSVVSLVMREDNQPICVMSSYIDITEQKMAEQRRLEFEAHQREFYRRTILAATAGKLVVAEREEIDNITCPSVASWKVTDASDLSSIRKQVKELALKEGMDEDRIYDFILAIGEATTNAVKHAHGGVAQLCYRGDSIVFVMSDNGPGIEALVLPEVVLTGGKSTAGTLGVGYKTILSVADTVYLSTGPNGTTLAIEMKTAPAEQPLLLETLPDVYLS